MCNQQPPLYILVSRVRVNKKLTGIEGWRKGVSEGVKVNALPILRN